MPTTKEPVQKTYLGCKVIKARPMTRSVFEASKAMRENRTLPDRPDTGAKIELGYEVEYPDGYISWSPKYVFENAYREFTVGELSLING